MKSMNIYVSDDTSDGIITINSDSKFSVARMRKEDVKLYGSALDFPGVYMLLIGDNSVYVGMSDLDTVRNRIMNTHSGDIDSSWHTVVGFTCNSHLSTNEYRFLENYLCEYAHQNYDKCVTTSPAVKNCTAKFREKHYGLTVGQIHSCNKYMTELIEYIDWLKRLIPSKPEPSNTDNSEKGKKEFKSPPVQPVQPEKGEWATFYYKSKKTGVEGTADILIHCGHTEKRTTILKVGSRLSMEVSEKFKQSENIKKQRLDYEDKGFVANGILVKDISFSSQSSAGQFLLGRSADGNHVWKTADGVLLKDLLE